MQKGIERRIVWNTLHPSFLKANTETTAALRPFISVILISVCDCVTSNKSPF